MISAEDMQYQTATGVTLLQDIHLDVRPGEVLGLIGPNGAGKSTLLGCLSGLRQQTRGTMTLDNRRLSSIPARLLARQRAVLPQSSALNFDLKVQDIVAMGRHPHPPSAQDTATIAQAMRQTDVAALAERRYTSLSGGERQRVHIARCLAQIWTVHPAYLFLDEPLAALDIHHQHHVMGLLQDMAHDRGAGVCIVLHDLTLAMRYTDRCALMQHGRVHSIGTPSHIFTPQNMQAVFNISMDMIGVPHPYTNLHRHETGVTA